MSFFYPDNPKRMARVHQLVDSLTNMQSDIKGIGKQMDDENVRFRPAVDALLEANGMASVDDVIKNAASKLTPDERKVFEALVKAVQNTSSGSDTMNVIACLLMAPAGVLTGNVVVSIALWGLRMVNVASLANFFVASEGGEAAAAAAAAQITAEAEETASALEGVSEAAEATEVGAEVTEAMSIVAGISTFLDAVAGIGFVIGLVAGIVDIFEGAEERRKLIDAIHRLQPARLTTARFKQEGKNILDQLLNFESYLDAWASGGEVAKLAEIIIAEIRAENNKIDLNELESSLEAEDRLAESFYGGADLSHDAVVAATSKD